MQTVRKNSQLFLFVLVRGLVIRPDGPALPYECQHYSRQIHSAATRDSAINPAVMIHVHLSSQQQIATLIRALFEAFQ